MQHQTSCIGKGRGVKGRGAEGRGAEGKGAEGKGAEGRGAEGKRLGGEEASVFGSQLFKKRVGGSVRAPTSVSTKSLVSPTRIYLVAPPKVPRKGSVWCAKNRFVHQTAIRWD